MEEYIFLLLIFSIEAIVAGILAYKGLWSKWGRVVTTIVSAIQDGKLTNEEINQIMTAIEEAQKK